MFNLALCKGNKGGGNFKLTLASMIDLVAASAERYELSVLKG